MGSKQWDRRQWLGWVALGASGGLAHCGGGAGEPSAPGTTGGEASGGGDPGPWALAQFAVNRRQWETDGWQGGDAITLSDVNAGATLVLCVWGYVGREGAGFRTPVDSQGQAVVTAADTGLGTPLPAQSVAWVLHNAKAGTHRWTHLPDLAYTGDGVAVLMAFTRAGPPSTGILGVGTATTAAAGAPWLSSGSVTMSAGARAGDLLVACSFQEEATQGHNPTAYTHPPAGWQGVYVNNDAERNIAGAVCWRTAPDAQAQTVGWAWSLVSGQDSSLFKGLVFALR